MKFMDLKREQTDVSWRSAHDSSNVIFTYGATDRGLIDLLGANVTHATLLAVPTEHAEGVLELLQPYAELPEGYRIATISDRQKPKLDGTLYWSRSPRWERATLGPFRPELVYAVPVVPEPPLGYRLANSYDRQNPKQVGTLFWSWRDGSWKSTILGPFQPELVYAVPMATTRLRAEIERLEAELEASRQRLDELKGGLEA